MAANTNQHKKPFAWQDIVYAREYFDYEIPFRVEDIWFSDGWYCSVRSMVTRKLYKSIETTKFLTKREFFTKGIMK